jgi:hypothetical protein
MNEEKEVWYKSKGVWGSLFVMILGILQAMNISSIGPVSVENVAAEQDTLVEMLTQIGIFAAGALALWGRLTARKKILLKGKPKAAINCILIILLLGIFLAGCSQVQMSPSYRQSVEKQSILITELDRRCQAGDSNACAEGLHEASETLNMIVDAMDGRQ